MEWHLTRGKIISYLVGYIIQIGRLKTVEKRTTIRIIGLILIVIYTVDVIGTTTATWNENSDKGYVAFRYPDGEIVKLESYFDVLYMTAIFVSTTSVVAIFGVILLVVSLKIKKYQNKIQ